MAPVPLGVAGIGNRFRVEVLLYRMCPNLLHLRGAQDLAGFCQLRLHRVLGGWGWLLHFLLLLALLPRQGVLYLGGL